MYPEVVSHTKGHELFLLVITTPLVIGLELGGSVVQQFVLLGVDVVVLKHRYLDSAGKFRFLCSFQALKPSGQL